MVFLKSRCSHLLLIVTAAGLLPGLAAADAVLEQRQGPATLLLTAPKIVKNTVALRLSDTLRLTLRVEGKGTPEVAMNAAEDGKAWHLEQLAAPRQFSEADGKSRWQASWLVQPLQPGQHRLQPPTLKYRLTQGDWQEVRWQPIPVQVATQVQKADLQTLQDIPGIETVPPAPASTNWLPLLVLIALGILLLLGVPLWLRGRPRQRPRLLPAQSALQKLDELPPLSTIAPAAFYTQLAEIVRVYLQEQFELSAAGQTSAEACALLAQRRCVSETLLSQLRVFLQQCDLARFAPLAATAEQGEAAVAAARALLQAGQEAAESICAERGREQLDGLQRLVA